MRIRKNRNISSFLLGLQTSSSTAAADDNQHLVVPSLVCQLNQSPWDVIPFSSSSNPYRHRYNRQFGADDNGFNPLAGCSSFGSVGLVDSEAKPKVGFGDEGCKTVREFLGPALRVKCAKTDGRSWECKREAKEGHNFCEHHISQLKSYSSGNGGAVQKPANVKRAGPGRVWAARKKKKKSDSSSSCSPPPPSSSASRSSQYYYYSGFGPSWRKKRGERPEGESSAHRGRNARTSDLQMEEETESEDEYKRDGDMKRVRKPIKARSLKSLM